MTKLEAITKVQECMSSVFSKEDVIKLINQLECGINRDLVSSISKRIKNSLQEEDENGKLIDYPSAEFELNHQNKIELTCVSIDLDYVVDVIEEHLMELVEVEVEVVKANNEL